MDKNVYYLAVYHTNNEIVLARQCTTYTHGETTGRAAPYAYRTITPAQTERISHAMNAARDRLDIHFRPLILEQVGWVAEWTRPCH